MRIGKAIQLHRFYKNQIWKRWIDKRMSGGGGNKYLEVCNWGSADIILISIPKKVLRIATNAGALISFLTF
jgi:hypothetical protein